MKTPSIMVGLLILSAVCNPVRGSGPNPGLKAVADASTDIAIAEVLDSQPRPAIEGARDTAKFKVIRTLKGPLQPGDEIGVYYHLLWIDAEKFVLEKPKFEKGKRYTLFLVKYGLESGSKSVGYTLTDQWLAGVRSAHTGDFQGKGSTNKEICLISPAF